MTQCWAVRCFFFGGNFTWGSKKNHVVCCEASFDVRASAPQDGQGIGAASAFGGTGGRWFLLNRRSAIFFTSWFFSSVYGVCSGMHVVKAWVGNWTFWHFARISPGKTSSEVTAFQATTQTKARLTRGNVRGARRSIWITWHANRRMLCSPILPLWSHGIAQQKCHNRPKLLNKTAAVPGNSVDTNCMVRKKSKKEFHPATQHLQCAEQQASPSNLTKYCVCHAKLHSKI